MEVEPTGKYLSCPDSETFSLIIIIGNKFKHVNCLFGDVGKISTAITTQHPHGGDVALLAPFKYNLICLARPCLVSLLQVPLNNL